MARRRPGNSPNHDGVRRYPAIVEKFTKEECREYVRAACPWVPDELFEKFWQESLEKKRKNMSEDGSQALARLTEQERRIVALLVQGYSNREIAAKLCIAEHVVKHDLCYVYDKLGVSTRLECAYRILQHPLDGSAAAMSEEDLKQPLLTEREKRIVALVQKKRQS